MTFDEQYPHAQLGDEYVGVFLCKDERRCVMCERLTRWVCLAFEGPLCSTACMDHLWDEYAQALRRANERDKQAEA